MGDQWPSLPRTGVPQQHTGPGVPEAEHPRQTRAAGHPALEFISSDSKSLSLCTNNYDKHLLNSFYVPGTI